MNPCRSGSDETGGGNDGAYDALSQSYDQIDPATSLSTGITNTLGQLPRNQEMLFVFSAGLMITARIPSMAGLAMS